MPQYQSERVRLLFRMNSVADSRDEMTGAGVDLWRQTDWRFECGFSFNDAMVDASIYESAKIEIMPLTDRDGAALAEVTVAAVDITGTVALADWQAGTAEHCVFEIPHTETNFDLGDEDSVSYFLVCSLRTTSGKWIVAGYSTVTVHNPGTPKDVDYPVQGGNLIGVGAVYDGSGEYEVSVTMGKAYRIAFGANETSVTNGAETLTAGGVFDAQGGTITLSGTPLALVTAVLRGDIYLSADELDARYFSDRQTITQAGHGLAAKDVVRFDGADYVKAQADSVANAEVVGVVERVDGDDFILVRNGGLLRGVTGLTAGTVYFLSAATAGLLTTTEPVADGQVSKPVLLGLTTINGLVFNYRGVLIDTGDDGTLVTDELLTGTINGSNVNFTTAFDFRSGSTAVYIRGVRQSRGGSNYSESGSNGIVFSTAPVAGDDPRIDYIRS